VHTPLPEALAATARWFAAPRAALAPRLSTAA
jgi:hypothetical protein